MAFVIWIIVSSTSSDPDVKTITDISISIPNLSDGLEVMKTEDTKAEIRIKGNKLVIGSVQSSDILVSADVSEVNKPGEYKLKLSAKSKAYLATMNLIQRLLHRQLQLMLIGEQKKF